MKSVFRVPFKHKGNHRCEAAVLTCIDFRFMEEYFQFVKKCLGIKHFDFPSVPGAAKTINEDNELAHACLIVPCELHHVKKLVLINHADCGAYGGAGRFANKTAEEMFHRQELLTAKAKLAKKFPDKEILTFFAKLDDDGENIDFIEVFGE
jgi:carbonic anhydrase